MARVKKRIKKKTGKKTTKKEVVVTPQMVGPIYEVSDYEASVTVDFESVGPTVAQRYLDANMLNRPVRKKWVRELADRMRNGDWGLSHQGVCFDEDGNLIDGQHRLLAVIKSGATIRSMVGRGFPRNSRYRIDAGARRSARDFYVISGGKASHSGVPAIARVALMGLSSSATQDKINHHSILRFLKDHDDVVIDYLKLATLPNVRATYHSGWVGAFVVASILYGRDRIDPMMDRLSEAAFDVGDPMRALFLWCIRNKSRKSKGSKSTRSDVYYACAVSAINGDLAGDTRKAVRPSRKDFSGCDKLRQKYLVAADMFLASSD